MQDLADAQYILLESYRKDGSPARTPVWAAPYRDKLAVWTAGDSYKVRRIRRNPTVAVAACNATGKTILSDFQALRAEVVESGPVLEGIRTALRDKYGFQLRLIELTLPLRGKRASDYVGLLLSPADER